jgi:acyl-CoA thioesterase FadM
MPATPDHWSFPLRLPRHAFSPREAARAGELWRLVQEAAVEGSTLAGWPPARYREVGTGFVVRRMRVVHHREAVYGEHLVARTWVTSVKRAMLTTREVRLVGPRGPVVSASTDWAHVSAQLAPTRASDAVVSAFPVRASTEGDGVVEPPPVATPAEGPAHRFSFRPWHTWMDPLGHVNHPAYLDWCDEATSRVMAGAGLDPVRLLPVAESVTFRAGARAGDYITTESRMKGRTDGGDVVVAHHILLDGGSLAAEATTVRRLHGGPADALAAALQSGPTESGDHL